MGPKTFKHVAAKWARCKHPFCSDCKTRRDNKRAVRAERHAIRRALHQR